MIRAVIFDFDETIIDLEAQHDAAAAELCREQGEDYFSLPESLRNRSGMRIMDEVRELREHFGWKQTVEELYAARQRAFLRQIGSDRLVLMPGAECAIREFHARDVILAVASSGVREYIERILSSVGLLDCFETIVAGEDVRQGKPHPETFLVAAERLGVEPSRCLVLEDSEVGVRAARAGGMWCIAIANPAARLLQNLTPAHRVLASLEDLDVDAAIRIDEASDAARAGRSPVRQ